MEREEQVVMWRRRGWFYESNKWMYSPWPSELHVSMYRTRYLGFISYHFIRLLHGEERLEQMAVDY